MSIAQCNNGLIFPGIGLGILAVHASRLTKDMIWAAARALSEHAPSKRDSFLPLLPPLNNAQAIAKNIAVAVARCAVEAGLALRNQDADLEDCVKNLFWEPRYLPFKRKESNQA
jgi:malate dehydrogenase (oxaloacetate-decarboxylating)